MKKYRYFYHFNKREKKMTVHFRGKCLIAKDIECHCPAETYWSARQPHLVMRGFCNKVNIINNKAVIE